MTYLSIEELNVHFAETRLEQLDGEYTELVERFEELLHERDREDLTDYQRELIQTELDAIDRTTAEYDELFNKINEKGELQ